MKSFTFFKLFLLSVPLVISASLSAQDLPTHTETFDSDFGVFGEVRGLDTESNSLGWANTNKAGGAAAGEFGGVFNRTADAGAHMIADLGIGDVSRLDKLTVSGKFFIEANNNFDGWIQAGFTNLAIIDADPITELVPFLGMCIIEPAETNFRAIGASGTTLSFKTRGELPADEADRVPVGVVVTFTYTWTPDPLVFGNGEFTCRFDWEGGGYDSNGTEIGEPDVTEWTFDAFMIGMGPAGSPDEPRQATVWFDDITYSVETAYEIPSDSVFANTSTRGMIDGSTTPEAILTPGIVISGNDPKTVLIRAVGPTLGDFGVTGFCPNPILTLYDQDDTENPIATNTNWGDAANAAQIEAAAVTVGAFALTTGSADAAILMTLPTNKAYTAQASCGDAGMGDVLVETYAVD